MTPKWLTLCTRRQWTDDPPGQALFFDVRRYQLRVLYGQQHIALGTGARMAFILEPDPEPMTETLQDEPDELGMPPTQLPIINMIRGAPHTTLGEAMLSTALYSCVAVLAAEIVHSPLFHAKHENCSFPFGGR